ncbi:MAG: twin-arginine translocase subunit TatC [Planctomycetota bacterium]|nr:twin-arginine translocase subunit TatC [Planctomycetota bacterium]
MPLDQQQDLRTPDGSLMSFGDHLDELRRRLILGLVVPLPLMIILFPFASDIRGVLTRPVFGALRSEGLPAQLQAMNPAETLATDLKLSIIFALVLGFPWILWQAWKFIEPGLYRQERRFVHLLIPGSIVLTLSGLALLYFGMLPLMLRVLIAFGMPGDVVTYPASGTGVDEAGAAVVSGEASDEASRIMVLEERPPDLEPGTMWITPDSDELNIAVPTRDGSGEELRVLMIPMVPEGMVLQQYRLREYINFILILMVGISIAFQMPLVILLMGWLGLIRPEVLERNRRYAVLGCGVVSAVITPADIVSMILMLVPLYALYELGILLLKVAPADRVARGAVFSGAVEDVLGRFEDGEDGGEDPDDPSDDDPGTPPETGPQPSGPRDPSGPPAPGNARDAYDEGIPPRRAPEGTISHDEETDGEADR